MSDFRRKSPFEQGELKASPDRHSSKKKKSKKSKKKSHQLPPEAKPYIPKGDEDDVQIIEAAGHGEEEGGSLTIKPRQTNIGKEKTHKHKKDKHRSRDFVPDGPPREKMHNDGKRDKYKDFNQPRDQRRGNFRDAREIVRERKKERELKEKEVDREITKREAKKREESIKERERLERMELERRRERQVREDHHVEQKDTKPSKRKEEKKHFPDSKRSKDYDRNEAVHSGEHNFRSRSRDRNRQRDSSKSFPSSKSHPEDNKGSSKKESSNGQTDKRSTKGGGDRFDNEQDTRKVVVDDAGDVDRKSSKSSKNKKDYREEDDDVIMVEEDKDGEEEKRTSSSKANNKSSSSGGNTNNSSSKTSSGDINKEVVEIDDTNEESEEEEEEEDSSDDSSEDSDDSSSEEDSSEEEEEEEEEEKSSDAEVVDRTDDGRGKVRSKFDDHSEGETPEHRSDSRSDNHYLPDSPEMSDLEEDLESDLPLYLPAIQGCRSVEEFNCLNRIEEGTYGVVYRALDKKTNEIVALKRLKMEKEREGFPITSLREINTLLKSQHENIVVVREIVVGSNMDKIYIVMEFVEHDLKSLMENMKQPFLVGEVKTLLKQLLRAVRHMHDNWILHRDLKTSNLLLSHKGILKVGDFGLAREYGSPLRNYTPIVVTLWYRAPELLLGCKKYSTLVDMWSVGCIFAEFLMMKALWPGKSEIDQINKIFKDLGTPTERIWPGVMELPGMKKVNFNDNPYNVLRDRFGSYFTDTGFDLLNRFLAYDPQRRITANDALTHGYFSECPLPVDPSMFPTWPARSEQTKKSVSSPKPPSGGKAYQQLMDDEATLAAAGGFHFASAEKGVSAQGMGFSLKF